MKINGERHYLGRAVDNEGEILESYVTKKRDKSAVLAFMKRALKRHEKAKTIVTDPLGILSRCDVRAESRDRYDPIRRS